MKLEKRIIAFIQLGETLRGFAANSTDSPIRQRTDSSIWRILKEAVTKASQANSWFTEENILLAFASLGEMLREDKIRKWVVNYCISQEQGVGSWEKKPLALLTPHSALRTIGVIMAGNIPLVGFHDFLCVLMSGNIFTGKLSSEDEYLLPSVSKILIGIEPEFKDKVHFTNQPFNKSTNISAFIATGSNNSARYFEYYFGKYPHIIRKNRNAIAILDGNESEDDLKNLGKDIFQYFGMGCRNVSKIFIPHDYNLDRFFESIVDFGDVINHNKYYNNHLYYRTVYLLNNEKFLDNNFLLVKESEQIASPVATLYYERYKNKEELFQQLGEGKENIQCIVAGRDLKSRPTVPFGKSQCPELWDYADGSDTMEFLISLPH